MRVRTGRLVWLLALGLLGAPAVARAQDPNNYFVPPPDPVLPLPLGGPRYEEGGFYFAPEFLYMMETNPLTSQFVAFRGFFDTTGVLTQNGPGTKVGSFTPALNVDQVSGPASYQPGFAVNFGWRFENGVTFQASWWHLQDVKYSATASLVPQGFNTGPLGADSFLSSPVFNFPLAYAGPDFDVPVSGPRGPIAGEAFGIWNGASLMTIDFIQRFDKVDVGARFPVQETENWRTYAMAGIRLVTMWERFKWRTVDSDISGVATPQDVANYTNVLSQRYYGIHMGCGNEWYLGSNPLGALSIIVEGDGAMLLDLIKERVSYELGDNSTKATHNRNKYNLVPEVEGNAGFMWYPTQAIQVGLTWDLLAFFNTEACPAPIDFNFGAIDPRFINGFTRVFNGVRFGVSFVF